MSTLLRREIAALVRRGDELWLYYTAGSHYGVVLDRPLTPPA